MCLFLNYDHFLRCLQNNFSIFSTWLLCSAFYFRYAFLFHLLKHFSTFIGYKTHHVFTFRFSRFLFVLFFTKSFFLWFLAILWDYSGYMKWLILLTLKKITIKFTVCSYLIFNSVTSFVYVHPWYQSISIYLLIFLYMYTCIPIFSLSLSVHIYLCLFFISVRIYPSFFPILSIHLFTSTPDSSLSASVSSDLFLYG